MKIPSKTIGLIGNPNTGKTTLFNQLTGGHQHVGNWAGVTVEKKQGRLLCADQKMTLVDLPGTYSLTTASEETSLDEQIACHFILSDEPDLLINVVDASNLERNLYLTLQLRELGVPCIIALNMLDIAEKKHIRIDTSALEKQLGCPVVTLVSNRGHGIKALKDAIARFQHDDRPLHVDYPRSVEQAISTLAAQIPEAIPQQQQRWLSLQCLDGDIYCRNLIGTIMQDPTLLSGAETLAL